MPLWLISLRKSAATKLFRLISSGNRPPQTFSAHFLRKSTATKLFQLISSGNRLPQNFFSSFPQEIDCHKTFSAHFLRKSAATKLFRLISLRNRLLTYSLISSGNRLTNPRTLSLFTAGLSLSAPNQALYTYYIEQQDEGIHPYPELRPAPRCADRLPPVVSLYLIYICT